MKKYTTLELDIESLNHKGHGFSQHEDYQVLTPYALPGQRVKAKVIKRKRKKADTKLLEVTQARPDEIPPRCAHFGQPPNANDTGCGGCHWQQAPYEAQLQFKKEILSRCLADLPLDLPEIAEVTPSPGSFGYRNKMEFSFGDKTYISDEDYQLFRERKQPLPRGFYLGLHVPKSFGTIVDVQRCHLISEPLSQVYQTCREWAPKLCNDPYNQRLHTGFWRHLILREGVRTGELMVHFNTTDAFEPDWQPLLDALLALDLGEAKISSVLHSQHNSEAQIVGFNPPDVLHGEAFIHDELCGLRFRISPYAFFQTNTLAAEKLYQTVVDLCQFKGNEVVYDLYSGTGTIGMILAQHGAGKVFGIESIDSAVVDARDNAQRNGVENIAWVSGKVEHELPQLIEEHTADWVILDPPRAGLHPKVPKLLNQLQVPQMIYVSCNPQALGQDLHKFCVEGPYEVVSIQPLDLFPQTPHLETVVSLRLKSQG